MKLDPARFAVRRDLADVALADRVFAPHYAKALMAAAIADDVAILDAGKPDAGRIAVLEKGDVFRVLEITDDYAWGQAGEAGAVGFVDRHALAATAE
ncbi:SH3 domain-containing protein [Sphingomonas gilva]|uniref:SH3 domain-containing protein n=1 Tax=Sphingomonas gilva TaxID=2305907 RepID=A0A396RJS2_9SPHN|nr:SH3 domain-containing protein [Sphingomonas gilva]RHW16434.1 SH3 domain-containing protein [Sphingomonas gilva]